MKVGILAAGEGSRLRAGGLHMPKPLLPIAGVPLIGHLLQALAPLDLEEIVCIINSQGGEIIDYIRQQYATLPLRFIQRDTASSFESFQLLWGRLGASPGLITTVDTICAPAFLPEFLAAARRQSGVDMVLTVTTFVDDEKPLFVRLDASRRIIQLGEAARGSGYVTSGFYYCAPSVSVACTRLAPAWTGALREFLAWLLQRGYWLQGYLGPKMIDVDRPRDLTVAEQFVRQGGQRAGRRA
jgi:NDP-sugar pyrophosphorylase family protein